VTAEEAIRDPYLLEFLGLKDEYSESDLEEALVRHLEMFLLELGDDFAFISRQRRLRIDNKWFQVDLVFFHRGLRCLLLIDLKIGAFTYADAGQMHLYLNYARENWVRPGENDPAQRPAGHRGASHPRNHACPAGLLQRLVRGPCRGSLPPNARNFGRDRLSYPWRPVTRPAPFLVHRAVTLGPVVRLGWGALFGPRVW